MSRNVQTYASIYAGAIYHGESIRESWH